MSLDQSSRLWFERIYRRLGLPFPLGALVGFLPFLGLNVLAYLIAVAFTGLPPRVFYEGFVAILPVYLLVNLYTQFASRYASRRIVNLADQWHLADQSISLKPLFAMRGTVVSTIVTLSVLLPLFDLSQLQQGFSIPQVLLIGVLPWPYYGFFFGTFFWVWAYSSYSIYRMGKLPLELKHFTEDRTLGLRSFGSASLRIAGTFVVFVALFAVPNSLQGFVSTSFLLLYIGLFLGALLLFLLPLMSLHRKLVAAKREIIGRFTPRYKELVQKFDEGGASGASQEFTDQLNATRQILQEATQIHTWPFDTGTLIRVVSLTVLPLIITVVGREVILLILGR